MPEQTELEKTQLEIARLQLEQERHKLAQLQKRQKVVNELGQGAVAVGGAAVGAGKWAACVALGMVLGGVMGWLAGAFLALLTSKFACQAYPDADFLYRAGCALGENRWWMILMAGAMTLYGAYSGHKLATDR